MRKQFYIIILRIYSHPLFLSSASPYFASMLPISIRWSLLETVAAPPYIKGAFCSPSLLSSPLRSALSLSLARGDLHPFCLLCLYFVPPSSFPRPASARHRMVCWPWRTEPAPRRPGYLVFFSLSPSLDVFLVLCVGKKVKFATCDHPTCHNFQLFRLELVFLVFRLQFGLWRDLLFGDWHNFW